MTTMRMKRNQGKQRESGASSKAYGAIRTLLILALALAAVEGLAWWWMNPASVAGNPRVLEWNHVASSPADAAKEWTWHPELVAKYQDSLGCSAGQIAHAKLDGTSEIYAAFFSWDRSSASVIEAYRHLPEECLGSIGMSLIEHRQPRSFLVGNQTIDFGHSVFRDHRGIIVHSFKATWVSGTDKVYGTGLARLTEWRKVRLQAALKRFQPGHARVIQGCVRGIYDHERAWNIFADSVLPSLHFESE